MSLRKYYILTKEFLFLSTKIHVRVNNNLLKEENLGKFHGFAELLKTTAAVFENAAL